MSSKYLAPSTRLRVTMFTSSTRVLSLVSEREALLIGASLETSFAGRVIRIIKSRSFPLQVSHSLRTSLHSSDFTGPDPPPQIPAPQPKPWRTHQDGVYFINSRRGPEFSSGLAYYKNMRDG